MSRSSPLLQQDELELKEIRELEQQLLRKQQEVADLPRRLERERNERERTMPPLDGLDDRKRAKRHEEAVTRGEFRNVQKAQSKSILLLLTLLCATAALIAWGLRLMEG